MGILEVIMEGSGLVNNLKVLAELFAYIYCLAELFGQKLKFSIHAAIFIIVDLFLMEGINNFGFPEYFHSLCYIAMFLYGLLYYGESIKITFVNCFIATVVVALLPLFLYLPLYYLLFPKYSQADLYGLLANIGAILLILLFRNKVKLKKYLISA